jgi:hypothetical protein
MRNSAQTTQQSGGFDVEPSETSCRGLALVTWIRRRRGSGGALVRFCSQKPGRRFSSAPAAFPPTDLRLPVAHTMVNVRRAPELLLPTIEGVMVRAGLAPPPPTICPARAPVERSTRWKRYHPYARATLPTRDMDDEYDVFAVSRRLALRRGSPLTRALDSSRPPAGGPRRRSCLPCTGWVGLPERVGGHPLTWRG